ncbi:MAG TPA: DUF6666 family protein [Pirellulales bacterium]|nr:DUF6666 family protein [Pirellulales bacterium]
MRQFATRFVGVMLALLGLLRLADAQELQLASDYDMLPVAGLPQPHEPANAWGLQTVDAPPSVPLPPPNGMPPTNPPVYTAPIDVAPAPDAWMTGSYFGRGVEFCRELCGIPDDWCPPRLDSSPTFNVVGYQGYDAFRQIPDGSLQETGIVQGANFGMPVPRLDALGVGFQAGATYGAYNLGGSPNRNIPTTHVSQQVFVTTGFFRRATATCPISAAIAYDWMIGDHLGTLSQNYTLGQGRAEIAWAFTARNQIGFNASFDCQHATKIVNAVPVDFRPVSQGNFFWQHRFCRLAAESRLWAGMTDCIRDNGDNSIGKMVFGMWINVPVTDRLAVYMQGMNWDTTTAGVSMVSVYDFTVGLSFYPRCTARSSSIAGRQWMPYLPVANNANFLTDTDSITP